MVVAQEPAVETAANETSAQTAKSDSLLGNESIVQTGKIADSVPNVQTAPKEEYEFDKRLYTEDGKFNKDGAKEFIGEVKAERDKYEKRILDLRRKVSDGKAVESKDKIFQDFAPKDDKYMPFFDKDTPPETKQAISQIQEKLADTYFNAALTQRQADDISNMVLDIMADTGIIDARSKEEKYIARQEWIEDQKRHLGSDADNIIRTTKHFVENTHLFDAKTKNTFLELMETVGAPVISALHQIADGKTGEIPVNVSNLGGLPSDVQLKDEYLNPATSEGRRQEIIRQRALAGRTGRLMSAGQD